MLLVRRTLDERLAYLVGEDPDPRRLVRRRGLPPTRAQTICIDAGAQRGLIDKCIRKLFDLALRRRVTSEQRRARGWAPLGAELW